MSEEERRLYKNETGESPVCNDQLTNNFKKWLERRDMQKAIQKVIEEEKRLKNEQN